MNKSNFHDIDLGKDIIEKIIIKEGKIEINVNQPDNNIETKYTLKNVSKSYYFCHCTKRPKCPGKAKFNIKEIKILYNRKMYRC